jgi:DNA repair protein RadA/Sms
MAIKSAFVCEKCGYESSKWLGRCPECSTWNSFTEITVKEAPVKSKKLVQLATSASPVSLNKVKSVASTRLSTGFAEFDRVLGGGIVAGSAILLSGDPGVGKSTLLLELAINIAKKNKVLYITGEESESQVKLRAERISAKLSDNLFIFSNGDIEQVNAAAEKIKPALLIVDSIQTMSTEELAGFPGSLPQIRHATSRLVSYAKRNAVPVFLIGHVTKEGVVAGPMLLSHMVDCVLYLEGSDKAETGTKILRSFKNRFGDTSEVGIFAMEEKGLVEITDTSNYFRDNSNKTVPGSCLSVVMEGSRPIIVEIQALVVSSNLSFPRRVASGISDKRLELLLAVIQKHLKIPIDRHDVFVNVVGGLKITETASDLAVCLAVLSSYKNKSTGGLVAIGEVGLLSEIKSVLNQSARVKEAKKLGYKKIATNGPFSFLSDIINST